MKGHEELECCAHEGDLCEPQKREKEAPVVEVSQDYVIHITSESCDDYGIHRFPKKPSDAELEAYLRNLYPGDFPIDPEDEDDEGPGIFGSCLHVKQVSMKEANSSPGEDT